MRSMVRTCSGSDPSPAFVVTLQSSRKCVTAMRSVHVPSVMMPMTAILASVSLPSMAIGPWTDEENDLIVADYFAMLAADLAGRPFIKADHNRRLRTRLDRSRPSIEFKHRNISAVMKGLGETWLTGYLTRIQRPDVPRRCCRALAASTPRVPDSRALRGPACRHSADSPARH